MPNFEERPKYRILAAAGFYGPDDHLYAEDSVIYYEDTPNEEMEPLNAPARAAQAAYFDHLDNLARHVAEKAGRPFTGRSKELSDIVQLASQDARRVQLVQGDGGIPLMGGKSKGASRVEAVVEHVTPQDGRRSTGKLSVR